MKTAFKKIFNWFFLPNESLTSATVSIKDVQSKYNGTLTYYDESSPYSVNQIRGDKRYYNVAKHLRYGYIGRMGATVRKGNLK